MAFNLLEKIKFLVQSNRMMEEIKMLEKVKALAGKLDGYKSVAGLLGIVAYYALPQFGIHVPDMVLKVSSGMAGVGLAHKLDKATGWLSKGLDILTQILAVTKSTQDELNKKEGDSK